MKTPKCFALLPGLLVLSLLAGCGKSRPPAPTFADLTNAPVAQAQADAQMLRFDARPGSQVTIDGTANIIHKQWRVQGTLIGGCLDVGPQFPVTPGQAVTPCKMPARAEVFIPVRSLKSVEQNGKPYSDHMDDIMYGKLKAEAFKRIEYHLAELVLKEAPKAKDAPYLFESRGELVIAGVTNPIAMPVEVVPLGEHKLKISGSVAVKMTSFKIEPPTVNLVLGKLVTGDDVKLGFTWMVAQKPAAATATNSPPQ